MNVLIKSVRLLLRIANTPPLRDVLDLHTTDTPSDDVFWPGDADPDKVQLCVSLSLLVHTLTWARNRSPTKRSSNSSVHAVSRRGTP